MFSNVNCNRVVICNKDILSHRTALTVTFLANNVRNVSTASGKVCLLIAKYT